MSVPVSLVVAVADNGVMGADGGMPWRLSGDLKRFKALTMGKPMVMGRKTFESIGTALPGRVSIVVTRQTDWQAEGAVVAPSVDAALDLAQTIAVDTGADGVTVIGGGEIYRQTRDRADRMDVTRVHAAPDGDTMFDAPAAPQWRLQSSEALAAGPKDSAATTYEVWVRA